MLPKNIFLGKISAQTIKGGMLVLIKEPMNFKNFIDAEINSKNKSKILTCIEQAKDLVHEALNDVSFLNWLLGKKHKGYLYRISIQFVLYEAVKSGALQGFEASIVPNKTRSDYHIELTTRNTIITINSSKSTHTASKAAIYREFLHESHQLYISFEDEEIRDEKQYLELTYKIVGKELSFVNLGIPNGKGKWFDKIDLLKLPRVVEPQNKEPENVFSDETLVKFKELVHQQLAAED